MILKRSTMRKLAMLVSIVVVATMTNHSSQGVEPERVSIRDHSRVDD
jgi:hypothetical protein